MDGWMDEKRAQACLETQGVCREPFPILTLGTTQPFRYAMTSATPAPAACGAIA